jgi:hypothetical protein
MAILQETSRSRTLVAYDRRAVYAVLRDQTPLGLREELRDWRLSARLSPAQIAELDALLSAWVQRALGSLSLRDALMIDEQRGRRVFNLLCTAHARGRATVSADLAARMPELPASLDELPSALAVAPALVALASRARREGLALAALGEDERYAFPTDLEMLLPPPPPALSVGGDPFESPTGWRRRGAALLAVAGVTLLVLPLLLGAIPQHSAGLPLALITLALLVGIKAGWAGYVGSLCIWLVANLPGFRHGSALPASLWPALPLIIAGLAMLWLDPRVRAMWAWIRRQLGGR